MLKISEKTLDKIALYLKVECNSSETFLHYFSEIYEKMKEYEEEYEE